jgi:hypothetical protein
VASRLADSLRRKRSGNRSPNELPKMRLCPTCKILKDPACFLPKGHTLSAATQCLECLEKAKTTCPVCKWARVQPGPCPCSIPTPDQARRQWKCYLCKNRKDKSLFPPHFGSNHKCLECCEKTMAKEALRQKKREKVMPAPSAKRVRTDPADCDLVLCPAPHGEVCSFPTCPYVPKEISAHSEVSVMDPQNRHYHPSCLLEARKEMKSEELKFSSLQGSFP